VSYPVAADALNAAGTPFPRGSVLVELRAGSVLAMSDAVYHRSGPNVSDRARRAWMPQFSDGDVLAKKKKEGGERRWEWGPVALAAPIDT
jgi:ectoine hydroxylase-related dioxygenase (phytanoyl-CoA dioxygenase family)